MKNVVFLIPDMGAGGAERVISILATELVKLDVSVSIVMMYGNTIHYALPSSVAVYELNLNHYAIFDKLIALRKLLRKLFCKTNDNYVVAFQDSCLKYAIVSSFGLGAKIISSERNNPYRKGSSIFRRFIATIPYFVSYKVVFQTDDARSYYFFLPDNKCRVIPNPIVSSEYKWNGVLDVTKLVSVCRLHPQKNIIMTIEVIDLLKKDFPNIHLDIYGNGELENFIKKELICRQLSDNISLCGITNNVPKLISKYSLFISTSDYEGISNSMLEAMSVGIPIVCTNCPIGGAKMMLSGDAGVLSPVGDVLLFAENVKRVLLNHNYAKYLGDNAKARCVDYSPSSIVNQWMLLFK